ncbi:MSHA biogenesis protein MshN [Vibrio sp. T187]|uniref:MSHA biogenesis protein MshN n=1 Tax=Vibrio TaxID=662 RepID=UPI0035BC2E4B
MSAINSALSELAKKQSNTTIEAAVVPTVKTRSPWVWLIAGFALSLTVGGWAITQSAPEVAEASSNVVSNSQHSVVPSPTNKVAPQVSVTVEDALPSNTTVEKAVPNSISEVATEPPRPTLGQSQVEPETKPVLVAKNTNGPEVSTTSAALKKTSAEPAVPANQMVIKQVELSAEQLAANARGRAQKALDSNDLLGALTGFTEALRYTPRDEDIRKKLAVLYFGKGDTRKAYELLQTGIQLNDDSEALRLSLSKLLIKANQSEAALSPLVHLPPSPSKDYLAMRAVLSQKSQHEEIALESYQKLVELDGSNARWWLGLGIQQERQLDFSSAKHSYQQALTRVGISSQSQTFVRDRLKILKDLEEAESAN